MEAAVGVFEVSSKVGYLDVSVGEVAVCVVFVEDVERVVRLGLFVDGDGV